MKRRLACLALMAAFPVAAASSVATLENDAIEVKVSLESGAIESVRNKGTGFVHRSRSVTPDIVSLRIPLGTWDGHSVVGSQADRVRVRERSATSLVLAFTGFASAEGALPVEAEVSYRLERDNLVVRLELANRGAEAINRIAFPRLGLAPAADGAEAVYTASGPLPLRQLFSSNRIRDRHDPFQRLDPSDFRGWFFSEPAISSKVFPYPTTESRLHTAWLSYEARGESIGFDVRDDSFQNQSGVVERELHRDAQSADANTQDYALTWYWFPLIAAGGRWESPEVWIKVWSGDWHGIARQHREWLDIWIGKPDPPEAFKASLGWLSQGVRSFDEIPGLARRGVEVGAPYFLVYGWYNYGMMHLSYDYYARPMLGGEEGLRRNLAAARELGAYPMAWYNGTTSVESTPGHQREGRNWVVVDSGGGFTIDGRWSLFDPDRPQTADDAVVHFNFDMSTPARDFVYESIRRLIVDYGFSGVELDQGGKIYQSYTGPEPELRHMRGSRELFERVLQLVRAHDANGIVVGEGMSDFMNQYVDSSWIFEGGGGIFAGPGDWVESASYMRYSLPWVTFPQRAIPDNPGHANQVFLLNLPLDIFADLSGYPDYADHLKRLHSLKQRVYPLLYGGNFSDREGFELSGHDPALVTARSYLDEQHDTVVVINSGPKPQNATVTFAAAGADARLTHYRLGAAEPATSEGGAAELELAPYDVVVLVRARSGGT